jgi:N-acetylglucosaminyldiphosphoundecaprenol N-acetyl-beta-D-mannosaminyltransferase
MDERASDTLQGLRSSDTLQGLRAGDTLRALRGEQARDARRASETLRGLRVDDTLQVLGVEIADLSMDEALALIERMLTMKPVRPRAVYFVNTHTLNLACADADFRDVLRQANYVFGDGTGVRWASRMLHGHPPKDNVNGTDLTPLLFQRTAGRGFRYFLLGNTPERIARAAQYTQRTFPGWTLAGFHHGYLDGDDHAEVVARINAARPHLLLVGMGNPLQERWIATHLHRLQVPVCMGIGGLFDYWSGDLERAPTWVRRLGHEWLHLLLRQPHKFKRYILGNPAFLLRVAASKLGIGGRKRLPPPR